MTTILMDRESRAVWSDSRLSDGQLKVGAKKAYKTKRVIAGLAGDFSLLAPLRRLVNGDLDAGALLVKKGFEGLALRHAVRGGTPDRYGDRFRTQLFILGPSGEPVEELVPDVHLDFPTGWFKRFVLRTDLPEQGAHVWTCFCPWDTSVFLTHLIAPSVDKIFNPANWAEAQDKHQRVAP